MKQNSLRKQGGHAALLFALIIPAMWGFFTLAIDGSRAIQTKARLGDATEVAALALAAQNSLDQVENRALATNYIDAYVSDVDITVTSIERTECNVSNSRDCDGASRYAQYALDVSIEQQSWLPTESWAGFGESYDVVHEATARKYQGDSIDVAFVMDFSGSMDDNWRGKKKYRQVQDIIDDVLDELELYQDIQEVESRVSLVSYSEFTTRPSDDYMCEIETRSRNSNCENKCYSNYVSCWYSCSSGRCQRRCTTQYNQCVNNCDDVSLEKVKPLKFVDQLRYTSNGYTVDIPSTINDLWLNKSRDEEAVCAFDRYDSSDRNASYPFGNEAFTEDFNKISKSMHKYRPSGWTSSLQGVIKAAQQFNELANPNPRQLLVVLSDGVDKTGKNEKPLYGYKPLASLVQAGLCSDIKQQLNSRYTTDNRPVSFQMALIGFDYDVRDNQALADCVGVENVYDAANPEELLDIILNLISEEIGHLK